MKLITFYSILIYLKYIIISLRFYFIISGINSDRLLLEL